MDNEVRNPEKRIFTAEHRKKLSESAKKRKPNFLGRHHSLETRIKIGLIQKGRKYSEGRYSWSKGLRDNEAPAWKGDNVGYSGLHKWVQSRLGNASLCYFCFSDTNVEWANKSHEYKRDLEDWIQLCRSCHHVYDNIALKRERDYQGRFI